MRALFTQFSGLIGVLAFINQMLGGAAAERAILVSVGAGLAVYVVLILGDLVIQRLLEHAAYASVQSPHAPPAPVQEKKQPPKKSTPASPPGAMAA